MSARTNPQRVTAWYRNASWPHIFIADEYFLRWYVLPLSELSERGKSIWRGGLSRPQGFCSKVEFRC
jgi:hypothetical protein